MSFLFDEIFCVLSSLVLFWICLMLLVIIFKRGDGW